MQLQIQDKNFRWDGVFYWEGWKREEREKEIKERKKGKWKVKIMEG